MDDYLQTQIFMFFIIATWFVYLHSDIDINSKVDDLLKQITKKNSKEWAVELFWNGSYAYTFVKHRCGKLYSTFPLVRSFVDAISEPKKSTKPAIDYPWASITQLIAEDDGKLRVMETKFDINDFEWQNTSRSQNLLNLNNMCKDLLQNNSGVLECLLLFAENDEGIRSRVINRKNMDMSVDVGIQANMSTLKFLSVDYIHPGLEESIELIVDKTYFMEGNHILSGAFVGRLLSKTGYTGEFDKSYRTGIIDQEIKTVELTYGDFVEISGDKKYAVKVYEENPLEPVQSMISANSLTDDDETKSWDKVDKE
jgi:hypothetical protein